MGASLDQGSLPAVMLSTRPAAANVTRRRSRAFHERLRKQLSAKLRMPGEYASYRGGDRRWARAVPCAT
jgi:hypothetical protein